MNCLVCKQGDTQPGITTVTLERATTTLVVKEVPAQICSNCGEAYMDEATTEALLTMLKQAVANGVSVAVRDFAPLDAVTL